MTIDEAAERLCVNHRTIDRWIKSGLLRTTRAPKTKYPYWRHEISIDALIEAADNRSDNSYAVQRAWQCKRVNA